MTEVIHLARGKCCGSGCRHCPYSHDRVPASKKAQIIQTPAWLLPPQWATNIPFDHKSQNNSKSPSPSPSPYTSPPPPKNRQQQEDNQQKSMKPMEGSGTEGEGGASTSGGGNGVTTGAKSNLKVVVLFWSTGKDSFLAYRALMRATAGTQTAADPPIPVRSQQCSTSPAEF